MQRPPRVLVTRSRQQGSALADELTAQGLEPVLIPAIEIADPISFEPLDGALAALASFHWLLFTSANAVEVFARRLGQAVPERMPKIGVIGSATERALVAIGLEPDLVPAQPIAESLAEELIGRLGQQNGAVRILLVRAEQGREILPQMLAAAGAELVIAPAYRNIVPEGSAEAVRELFGDAAAGQGVEAITFTSSSTARNLLALCETAGVSLPDAPLRVSIGPITSRTLREVGIPPHAEAPEASVRALAETVAACLLH